MHEHSEDPPTPDNATTDQPVTPARREPERRRSRGRQIIAWIFVAAIALLAYDSTGSALASYRDQHGTAERGTFAVTRCSPGGCLGDVTLDPGTSVRTGVRLDTGQRVQPGQRIRVAVRGERAVPLGAREWAYPATVAGVCVLTLAGMLMYALRRRAARKGAAR